MGAALSGQLAGRGDVASTQEPPRFDRPDHAGHLDGQPRLRFSDPDDDLWRATGIAQLLDDLDFLFLIACENDPIAHEILVNGQPVRVNRTWQEFFTVRWEDCPQAYTYDRGSPDRRPHLVVTRVRSGSLTWEFVTEAPANVGIGAGALLTLYMVLRNPDALVRLWSIRDEVAARRTRLAREQAEDLALLEEAKRRLLRIHEAAPMAETLMVDGGGAELPVDEDWFWAQFEKEARPPSR